jgi:hypothetical protein
MSKEPAARYRMADQLGHILESLRERGGAQTVSGISASTRPPQPNAPTLPNMPAAPTYPAPQQYGGQTYNNPGTPPPQAPYAGVDPLPTQRVDLAPNAPGMPVQRPLYPQQQAGYTPNTPYYPPQGQPPVGSSQQYSQPYVPPRAAAPASGLDMVTIALAILAFFAVACLIPLYIAVFQARA